MAIWKFTTEIRIPPEQITAANGDVKRTPCVSMLGRILSSYAGDHDDYSWLTTNYRGTERRKENCLVAVRTRNFPGGVGLLLEEEGCLSFRYNKKHPNPKAAWEICRFIRINYAIYAIVMVLNRLGYRFEKNPRFLSHQFCWKGTHHKIQARNEGAIGRVNSLWTLNQSPAAPLLNLDAQSQGLIKIFVNGEAGITLWFEDLPEASARIEAGRIAGQIPEFGLILHTNDRMVPERQTPAPLTKTI